MSLHYYLRSGRMITGPFSEQQIREKVRIGQVTRQAEISPDKRQWEPLVRILIPEAGSPVPVRRIVAADHDPAIPEAVPAAVPPDDDAAIPEAGTGCGEAASAEQSIRVIGSTLQLMWDSPAMLTYLLAAEHPRRNALIYGTGIGFPLLLAVLSAAVLNAVLNRSGVMWLFCSGAMLTLLAVPALEGLLLRAYRPADNVLAETLVWLCGSAMLVPALLYYAALPLLLRAGLAYAAVPWGAAVLAAGAFFTVQMTAGLLRLLMREHGLSMRAAAVCAAGVLWQTGMLAAAAVWFFNLQKGI